MTTEAKGPQYAIVPPDASSPLPKAVGQVLELCLGYEKELDSKNPKYMDSSLIIVDSIENYGEKQGIDPDHLVFYRHALGGATKHILYLGPFREAIHTACPTVPWVYSILDDRHRYKLAEILARLQRNNGGIGISDGLPLASEFRELLPEIKHATDLENFQNQKGIKESILENLLKEKGIQKPIREFFCSNDLAVFYFALVALTANYEYYLHYTERRLASGCPQTVRPDKTGTYETVAKEYCKKLFFTKCNSLRRSLGVIHSLQAEAGPSILLIDDDPSWHSDANTGTAKEFRDILKAFFPKNDLHYWNPFDNRDTFSFLRRYRSLNYIGADVAKSLKIKVKPAATEEDPCLLEALKEGHYRFILIDMLYDKKFLGPEIVRGVSRLVRDLEVKRIPEVIAISRTPDPGRIQEALQAGARSYVLKSDLLELPAVLSGISSPISEEPTTLQRNFRRLYQLPNDVRGLIHDLKIPRVDWRAWRELKKLPDSARPPHIASVSKILEAIPKTDLHVHIGSCMEPEFLVLASFVGLVSHQPSEEEFKRIFSEQFKETVKRIAKYVDRSDSKNRDITNKDGTTHVTLIIKSGQLGFKVGADESLALSDLEPRVARRALGKLLGELDSKYKTDGEERETYRLLRSSLHEDLKIRDELDIGNVMQALDRKPAVEIAWFVVKHEIGEPKWLDYPTFVRLFLLCIAARGGNSELLVEKVKPLPWFTSNTPSPPYDEWKKVHDYFYETTWRVKKFRKHGWALPPFEGQLADSI